ncbi:MAG TPA: DUF4167 domain-containing protein, partial [Tistrella mobilis]|nr:DUF4167 domain-containing protein [Tistrella mobilis]
MRNGPNSKRTRMGRQQGGGGGGGGRPRPQQPVNRNRIFESNGPAGKIKGNLSQVIDRYLAAARDASSSGDRVLAESCLQHAEHYLRLMNGTQDENRTDRSPVQDRFSRPGTETDSEEDETETGDAEGEDEAAEPAERPR